MSGNFQKLLSSVKIGKVEIKNRVAMAPMGNIGLVRLDGSLRQRGVEYYLERARGGVGLIITGIFRVENEIETTWPGVPLISRAALAPFAELAEAVHSLGTKVFVQLTAGLGRVVNPLRLRGNPVSSSASSNYWRPSITCRELETKEVEKLVKCFGNAAEILVAAGIDGVELHGHEGYLFDQFTTSIWNKRTDKYGGDLRGRLRFPVEVLQEIRAKAGQDFPVQYRFGLKHYLKGLNEAGLPGEAFIEAGRDIPEGLEMARLLEEAGFDALHVDAGCYESWYWPHTPTYQEHGCMIGMAAEAKRVVQIPVIGVGKLDLPELAEKILADSLADMVAIGKGLLSDPFWVKKIEEGQPQRIRPCIGCQDGCMGRIGKGKPLSCAVNPATGRERAYRIERTDHPQKLMIVGSGPAGMEAARVASLRGHEVTLYEKTNSLGGHLIEASIPEFKKDMGRLLDWFKRELEMLPVEIKTGAEVTPELIQKEKPGALVIAAGSKPIIPDIPGIETQRAVTAIDLLLGKKKAGETVLVLGGGLIGCETALWLAQQGKKVTIVEILEDLMIGGIPVQHMNRLMMLGLLKFHAVRMIPNASLLEVKREGMVLMGRDLKRKKVQADTVVLAIGLESDQYLYNDLKGKGLNLFLIGDSRTAQNIMGAVWDAYEVARML